MTWLRAVCDARFQRAAVTVAAINVVVYVLSISYRWLGPVGRRWTHLLNHGQTGDLLTVWFCSSAALLLMYSVLLQIHVRSVTWAGVAGLSWCALWGLELIWLHRFLVFG